MYEQRELTWPFHKSPEYSDNAAISSAMGVLQTIGTLPSMCDSCYFHSITLLCQSMKNSVSLGNKDVSPSISYQYISMYIIIFPFCSIWWQSISRVSACQVFGWFCSFVCLFSLNWTQYVITLIKLGKGSENITWHLLTKSTPVCTFFLYSK